MKIIADEDRLTLVAENDFDVMALNHWRNKKTTVCMETYKRDVSRHGEESHASGWLYIGFKKVKKEES